MKIYSAFLLSLIVFIATSCSNKTLNDDLGDGTTAIVSVNLINSEFDDQGSLGRAATKNEEPVVFRNTIEFSDDMLLVAEMSAVDEFENQVDIHKSGSSKKDSKAAVVRNPLVNGIRYRVLVFNSDGTFNTDREFVRGSETAAQSFQLFGGRAYTFIVYSVNTSDATVAPTFTGGVRTLANATINVGGSQDFMWFRQELSPVGGPTPNELNVVLKHRFSQITTTVNSSQTGYNITELSTNFTPHNTSSLITLSTGNSTRNGESLNAPTNYPTLGSQVIVGTPTIVNAETNSTTRFNVSSITINGITQTNLQLFSNLPVTPGVRYNLTVNVVPNDQFITYGGQPAARINGAIWARHNLGVPNTVDADALPMTVNRHGDYYQWGRDGRSAANTGTTASPFASPNNTVQLDWNAGNATAPAKGRNDPCPANYRIPSRLEQEALIAATTATNSGTFVTNRDANNNYGVAKILTSRRNSSVRLTFPVQGYMNTNVPPAPYENRGIFDRARFGYYWNNGLINGVTSYHSLGNANSSIGTQGDATGSKVISLNIRCIGIQPLP